MPNFRVDMTYERPVTFYLEAESQADIEGFLDSHPDFNPGDVPGLIDVVGEESEVGYEVYPEDVVVANFRVTPKLDLAEVSA